MRGFLVRLLTISAIAACWTIVPSVQAQPSSAQKAQADQLLKTGDDLFQRNVLLPASQTLERALKAYQAIGDLKGQRETLVSLARVETRLGRYAQALARTQQAQALPGSNRNDFTITSLQALIQYELGNYREALRLYRAAASRLPDIASETRNRLGLGETLHALGFYTQALDALTIAIKTASDRVDHGRALNAIADTYFSLGQYETAQNYYKQALDVRRGVGDWLNHDRTLQNLGRVSQALKQPKEARSYYEQALKGMNGRADHLGKIGVYRGMAQLAAEQGQAKQALAHYQDALVTTRLTANAGKVAVLNDLGFFYKDQQQYEKAIATLDEALALARRNGDTQGEIRALSGIGEAKLQLDKKKQGQAKQASEALQEAIEQFESLRPGLRDADKVALFETHAHIYRLQQQALVRQNRTSEALAIAERGRARAFVELLSQRLSKEETERIKPPTVAEIQAIAKQQRATIVTYSIIYGANREESELYSWVVRPTGEIDFRQVDLKKIQNRLNISLDKIARESRSAVATGEDDPSMTNFVLAMRGTLTQEETTPAPILASTQNAYQVLIDPISDLLPKDGKSRVIFIPQDALFLVPFAALQDAEGQYLIQKHPVQVSPSIQALTLQKSRPVNNRTALIVGNPTPMPDNLPELPGSEREATAIAQLFNTQAIVGREATKSRVLQKISQASVIHFATHGLLDDQQALQSSLALSASDLTAEEIFDLQLNADLAVLSACNTGRGKITGDGVIGLSRSLMSAGVPSVVVSLWLVPDEATAHLMKNFYRELKQGSDKAQALQKAMLETQKKYPNPRDWAGFTLIGSAD